MTERDAFAGDGKRADHPQYNTVPMTIANMAVSAILDLTPPPMRVPIRQPMCATMSNTMSDKPT